MKSERSLVKKILYVISGFKDRRPDLTDIEFVFHDGVHVGYKIEITVVKKPGLKIIKGDKKKD